MQILAQVCAQYENKELEALIKEKQENLEKLKSTVNGIKTKKVPTTDEEAWDVVTNKTQSQATKECIACLKGVNLDSNATDCAQLCGFGAK